MRGLWYRFRAWRAPRRRAEVTFHPEGGRFTCPHCSRTFRDSLDRAYHVWKDHPGCPKYAKPSWGRWLTEPDAVLHSCRCQSAEECEHGCWEGLGPYR